MPGVGGEEGGDMPLVIGYGDTDSINNNTVGPNQLSSDDSIQCQIESGAPNVSAFITDWDYEGLDIFTVSKTVNFPQKISRTDNTVDSVFTFKLSASVGECLIGEKILSLKLYLSSHYLSSDGETVNRVAITDSYPLEYVTLNTVITAVNLPFGNHLCKARHAVLYEYGEF